MRGEVWLVHLDPTQGSEIRKTRPCLIVSPSEVHDYLPLVMVVPLTSKSWEAPFHIPLAFNGVPGRILLEQIRAVDQSRLVKKLGEVPEPVLRAVLHTLQELFAE